MRLESFKPHILNFLALPESSVEKKQSLVRRGYDWFCGFDDSADAVRSREEQQEHLRKITSLKQNPKAKLFLNINLAFLVCLATFLYVFFSTKNFGIFD